MPLKINGDVVVRLSGAASSPDTARLTVIRDVGVVGDRKCAVSPCGPADTASYGPGIERLRSCLNTRV